MCMSVCVCMSVCLLMVPLGCFDGEDCFGYGFLCLFLVLADPVQPIM